MVSGNDEVKHDIDISEPAPGSALVAPLLTLLFPDIIEYGGKGIGEKFAL